MNRMAKRRRQLTYNLVNIVNPSNNPTSMKVISFEFTALCLYEHVCDNNAKAILMSRYLGR